MRSLLFFLTLAVLTPGLGREGAPDPLREAFFLRYGLSGREDPQGALARARELWLRGDGEPDAQGVGGVGG